MNRRFAACAVLAAATLFSPPAFARHDDADERGPVINLADADLAAGILFIHGEGFGVADAPVVTLGGVSLLVVSFSTTDVVASLGGGLNPGTYPLRLGSLRNRGDDEPRWASLDVTLGTAGKGSQGPQGPAGPQGAQGPPGPAGDIGPTGPQGPAGAIGPTGPQGPAGAIGPTGPQGPAGAIGLTGPQGPAGAIGPQGPAGAAGAIGPTGPQGPAGAAGAIGPAGPQGPAGAVGPAGPQGPAGADGTPGIQGVQGPAGPAGPAGGGEMHGISGASGLTSAELSLPDGLYVVYANANLENASLAPSQVQCAIDAGYNWAGLGSPRAFVTVPAARSLAGATINANASAFIQGYVSGPVLVMITCSKRSGDAALVTLTQDTAVSAMKVSAINP